MPARAFGAHNKGITAFKKDTNSPLLLSAPTSSLYWLQHPKWRALAHSHLQFVSRLLGVLDLENGNRKNVQHGEGLEWRIFYRGIVEPLTSPKVTGAGSKWRLDATGIKIRFSRSCRPHPESTFYVAGVDAFCAFAVMTVVLKLSLVRYPFLRVLCEQGTAGDRKLY